MNGQPPNFVLSQYDGPDLNWHMFQLARKEYKGFARSLDIYGDGTALLVDLSGHSDGHLGLFITLASGKQTFFIGDTAWAFKGIVENKSRPAFVDWMIGADTDFEMNALLVEKIHLLSKKEPELFIVPAHDELQLKMLPVFPEFSH